MNAFLYRRLLGLYPSELRAEFGEEIVDLFLEELAAARGWGRKARVWRVALRESAALAIRGQMDRPAVAVPLLASVFFLVSESPLVVVNAVRRGGPGFLDAVAGLAMGASVVAATTWFAVRRKEPVRLKLD